jgi:L-seryl-tRNA(Ser) seleniumtransferase
MNKDALRDIPSVDRVLQEPTIAHLEDTYGRDAVVAAVRQATASIRASVLAGEPVPDEASIVGAAGAWLSQRFAPTLRPVINATGVILHTNLGRAPLSRAAVDSISQTAQGYASLEYDLERGHRGHRSVHAGGLLCELTGAEAGFVVNNNAGAVLLALTVLARGRGVVISRGQLVEIGGGFRIPDVMLQSGARLVEVGTTNRTHLGDYRGALTADRDIAAILRAHHSNFRVVGFTHEPGIAELVGLGAEVGLPVIDDLGSGALLDTARFGIAHEPMVQESVEAGAHIVCFSGDKLLGGPQAGVIVGKAECVDSLRSHPLARALRPDKLCLAALQSTLEHYLRGDACEEIPVWQMIATPLEAIEQRVRRWHRSLRRSGVATETLVGESTVGGGSLPGEVLPTRLLAIPVDHPDRLAASLRLGSPPVVARIEDGRVVLDGRTVLPEQDSTLLDAVRCAFPERGD